MSMNKKYKEEAIDKVEKTDLKRDRIKAEERNEEERKLEREERVKKENPPAP
ncbi:MAG: hypothetical protein LUC43_08240 [Burkholderiales bacterium]|nr:hypothetical protein [Burkholderiales bacterium]